MLGASPPAEYGAAPIPDFLDASMERYVADGMPLQEVLLARRSIVGWDGWWPYWMKRSEALETEADRRVTTPATHRDLMVIASLAAHVAQYLHFEHRDEKAAGLERKVATYRRACESMDHPTEITEIPFQDTMLPAIVHLPIGGSGPLPWVIYVGGLDAHKEDAHAFVRLCIERGLAVVAYDGPGQGEAVGRGLLLEPDAHKAVSAVIDHIESHSEFDGGAVGAVGRSLGGYLAPRAAADDERLSAVAVWGAMYDLEELRSFPKHTQAGFMYITGSNDLNQAADRLKFVDMSDHSERITCPVLVVHGELDALTPPDHARRLAADLGDRCDLELVPGSGHCNHDRAHLVRPMMVDWLSEQLRQDE